MILALKDHDYVVPSIVITGTKIQKYPTSTHFNQPTNNVQQRRLRSQQQRQPQKRNKEIEIKVRSYKTWETRTMHKCCNTQMLRYNYVRNVNRFSPVINIFSYIR